MTGAVAQTKFSNLYDKARDLLRTGASEIEIARLASEAKSLRNADVVESREILALVSLIKREIPEAIAEYEKAIQLSGRRFDVVARAMMILGVVGQSMVVGDLYRRYVDVDVLPPDDREFVASAIGFSGWAAESTSIRLAMKDAGMPITPKTSIPGLVFPVEGNQKEGEAGMSESASLSGLMLSHESLAAAGVSDEWVAERVGSALRFLLDEHKEVMAVRPSPVPQEGGRQGLIVNFFVDEDLDATSQIEWDLFGHLASAFPDVMDNEDVSFALVATGGMDVG